MKYVDIADYNSVSFTPEDRVTIVKNGEEITEVLDFALLDEIVDKAK